MLKFLRRLLARQSTESAKVDDRGQGAAASREQAEIGQRQSLEDFDELVASVRDYAIFRLDRHGNVASWNAAAQRIKGYRAEEIVGQHFSRFYPQEAIAAGWPANELDAAAKTGRFEDENWRLRKDGSRFWANVVITALKDESGGIRGFLKITRDLTERKQAEENARRLLEEEGARRAAEASAVAARASALAAEQAQREERHQREQLRVTLSSIGDAVIVTDGSGLVTFLNAVAEKITGWQPRDAIGEPLDRIFHIVNEETGQRAESPVAKVLRDGVVVGLANHTVLIARDGREVPIDDSGAPIRGEDGSIAGVVLVFRDVTEARRAVQARLHLAAIVESSDDAIISKTLDGIITSWNRAAERLYGYTAAEAVGKPLSIIAPPDQPDELPELMKRLQNGEQIEHHETVRVRKDGSRVDVSLAISPIKNAEGKIIGASKIARDITARKRNEASLRFLAEASKVLGEILDVNSTLQRVARLAVPYFADWCAVDLLEDETSLRRVAVAHVDPAKVALARDLQRRYPPDPGARLGVWNIVRTGQSELASELPDSLLEQTVHDPEMLGVIRELGLKSYMGVPLILRGKTIGVLTFVAAESGHRYDAAELRLAEDLAHRAAIAIDNARLYSELRDADRRKDEFLAMLAHELRNPLAPIRNALQVMKMAGASGRDFDRARQITERQLQHMVRLVDDLLDVSRIMRGRIELRKETVDLAQVIAHAVETAHPILDSQGQELILSIPPGPLWLEADPTRLAQVISNLLHNAAKFSERPRRVWLSAELAGDDKGRPEAVLRVKDEGAGIAPQLLPHLFDLFVQGDRSPERAQGGLGIGLTVVRKVIELHGGTVTAHSEGSGKGSEFVVRLPVDEQAARGEKARPAEASAGATTSRRVLVVDDNVDAAESIVMLASMWGHNVRAVHTGPEALQAAREYKPEVIILDIGLPGMNGYEVARHLRQQPEFRRTLLVAVTGYGQESDRRHSFDAGFDHHLTKPVVPETLRALIVS
jgi:PAS domain S-box-containing protein